MKKLYILSSGAGGLDYLTSEAKKALSECEAVVSYKKYAKELSSLIGEKELFTSGMTKEIERVKQAIEFAKSGKTTAIISNGDVNIYGLATLVIELMDEMDLWEEIEVESIAGVTSFLAGASRIGAPVTGDFAVISLSDKLTDIELIDKRVQLALQGDFVLGIYNPRSRKRIQPYLNFLQRLKEVDEKIVIIAQNIGRESEKVVVTTSTDLIEQGLNHEDIGMNTLLIVGNSTTRVTKNGLVLTPRGYLKKYDVDGELKS